MGCMRIKMPNGKSGMWCDGEQDVIDEWLDKKFGGKVYLNQKNKNREIYHKILTNKRLYNEGYALVKKNFHSDPKNRDMTPYEYENHLCFGLGIGTPEDNKSGVIRSKLKVAKGILSHNELLSSLTSGKIRR
jgi:hypothetical protein